MKQHILWDLNNYINQDYTLPKINCTFDIKTNINSSVKEDQEKWILEFFGNSIEKSKKYLGQQTFLIYMFSFPFASPDELKCIFKIMDWAFIIDDFYFESKAKGMSYLEKLFKTNKDKSKDKFIKLFWEIINEYKQIGKKDSIDVLINEIYSWAKSAVQCSKNDQISSNSTLAEYMESRYYDIGIIMALASSTTLISIPKEIRESKIFKQLEYWFVVCNTLINDCYSFNKEKNEPVLTNYVKIKTLQCGSIQTSLDFVAETIENSLTEINNHSNQLIQQYPNNINLKQYIKSLKYLTSGHLHVSSICNRYK
ncbi:hypothetical protein DICPUDRAFT_29342 [Dictyostelium purpureum]|uniref:Terpene synthase 6 n=1 Tax=Dictyostelium purpureum TaxID=5786 RepID=TPS6_DICPU|nr:uncharacterized protein DICPUDRAFT_29342 [Dictyostelium purpureum]F0ZDD0.1 RecName: Full=Terpene synthase 6 [Dictyostelium purpureum]AXN72975.1 terpene synthase [Dictyostelium purpureum]EGC38021.1 hypothetical protein DICPUDRAFT_29342 [Dictyostelium purpureum]|eukprot:XP_003285422.1 hypothetical protein DICPUDRAFT_29342 [Dictyostelium purpureum]